jgi:hypothetical protein
VTLAGIVVLDVSIVLLIGWILDLVRRGRLYVGYGVIFVAVLGAGFVVISLAALRGGTVVALRGLFPAEPLAVILLGFVTFMLIYILNQLSVISNRVATLAQELAIRGVDTPSTPAKTGGDS